MDELLVLIAEQEAGIARLLQVLMERRGYATEFAWGGVETLELARQHRPDLIILDPVMSILDGDEVLRQLALDPSTAEIPVVLVTTKEIKEALKNGYHEHVTKPFDPRRLDAAIERALSTHVAVTAGPPLS